MAKFAYHGPVAFIVALDREVSDGDVVDGPDELAAAAGFSPVEDAPQSASGSTEKSRTEFKADLPDAGSDS